MYATQLNHKAIVVRLSSHGVNKTLLSKAGFTALDYALIFFSDFVKQGL